MKDQDTLQDRLNAAVGQVPVEKPFNTAHLKEAKQQAQERLKQIEKERENEPKLEGDVYEKVRGC